jgi:hypothetical protein
MGGVLTRVFDIHMENFILGSSGPFLTPSNVNEVFLKRDQVRMKRLESFLQGISIGWSI